MLPALTPHRRRSLWDPVCLAGRWCSGGSGRLADGFTLDSFRFWNIPSLRLSLVSPCPSVPLGRGVGFSPRLSVH